MTVEVPDENYYSLNQVADFASTDRQSFRKLVGEFERQACKLPTRPDDSGQELKCIPWSFVHIFEEAVMWQQLEDTTPGRAMGLALHTQKTGALQQLAVAVNDRAPLLKLPRELRTEVAALVAAAKTERRVSVNLLDQQLLIDLVGRLRKEAKLNWWIVGLVALLFAFVGFWAGSIRTDAHLNNMQQRFNDSQYALLQQLQRIEHQVKQRGGQ